MLGYGCLYDFVLFCFILLFSLCRFLYFILPEVIELKLSLLANTTQSI